MSDQQHEIPDHPGEAAEEAGIVDQQAKVVDAIQDEESNADD